MLNIIKNSGKLLSQVRQILAEIRQLIGEEVDESH